MKRAYEGAGVKLTPQEVAMEFGVDSRTVIRWADEGKFLPGTITRTPGGQRRFALTKIRELQAQLEEQATA